MDLNNDGEIDRNELRIGLQDAGVECTGIVCCLLLTHDAAFREPAHQICANEILGSIARLLVCL